MRSTISSRDVRAARARRLTRAAAGVCLLGALGVRAFAHDFWVEPASFHPAAGELVALRFLVGEQLEGEEQPRRDDRIVRFVDRGPGGTSDVLGRDGQKPAGVLRPAEPGLHTILYEGTPSYVELEAEKFEAYLREEGLEHVIEERATAGRTSTAGRERYSRHAKVLLRVGETREMDCGAPLGAVLEIVPEGDPFAGEEPAFRLLYRGAPLADTLVEALARPDATMGVHARTDAEGRVRLRLPEEGMVLVKAVHMVAVSDGDPKADWESFWASLTLERGVGGGGKAQD